MALRLPRLIIILTISLVAITLYLLYPSQSIPRSPGIPYSAYEAGGIDSPHYRNPILPDFEKGEKPRLRSGSGTDGICLEESCDDQQSVIKAPERGKSGGLGLGGWFGGSGNGNKGENEAKDLLHGDVIMPKLGNETVKAELGRAAWRVLHLMTLRYPEDPTEDDRAALKSYFHLFARLYPCGECAAEFQALLKEFPPQTSSRKSASQWLCHVHNVVNIRLGKPEFDCLTLDATYDCGCGDHPDQALEIAPAAPSPTARFPPPQKGQIGAKILGGKKNKDGSKEGWKNPHPPPAAVVENRQETEQGTVQDEAQRTEEGGKQAE